MNEFTELYSSHEEINIICVDKINLRKGAMLIKSVCRYRYGKAVVITGLPASNLQDRRALAIS